MNNNLKPVNILPPFKKFCVTIGELPTSYLESMTYYEMLIWFTKYLQETIIPTINNNGEAVEELQGLYIELKTFVNNYFDNLDVQEEINNKLDEMAESGELTDIIAQYLGLAGMIAFDTVSDMKLSENLVNGSKCCTLGFHTINDGGKANYKIRTITNEDTVDEMTIIALHNNTLIAELVIGDSVCPEMFGAYGDSDHDGLTGHDDTAAIQAMFDSGYEIFSLRPCIYKITSSIIIPEFKQRKLVLKGEIAYTGTNYAINFNGTGRVSECNMEFGNIFANHGGCIAFHPNTTQTAAIAGMRLSGNIFYAGSGENGDCIYVENDGWFNENFINDINFQHGNYAFRLIYKNNDNANKDCSRNSFNECHFEGVTNGVYMDVNSNANKQISDTTFNNCRMVETISGYFCNIQTASTTDSPSVSSVVINNDVYADNKLTGNVIYIIQNGYTFDKTPSIRNRGLQFKRIYGGKVLNPPVCDPGSSLSGISTDSTDPTVVDLTTSLIVPQLRGSNNNDYYLTFNVSPYTFYTLQEFHVGGWANAKYHIKIQTSSYTFNIVLEFPNDSKLYTFYVDYQNNKCYYI